MTLGWPMNATCAPISPMFVVPVAP